MAPAVIRLMRRLSIGLITDCAVLSSVPSSHCLLVWPVWSTATVSSWLSSEAPSSKHLYLQLLPLVTYCGACDQTMLPVLCDLQSNLLCNRWDVKYCSLAQLPAQEINLKACALVYLKQIVWSLQHELCYPLGQTNLARSWPLRCDILIDHGKY